MYFLLIRSYIIYNVRVVTQFVVLILALTLSATGTISLAQESGERSNAQSAERLSAARRTGEITVREGEHLFAIGRALVGDDLVRVNRFRKDVLALNPALGASGERIAAGMRLKLPEYVRTTAIAPAAIQIAPQASAMDQAGAVPRRETPANRLAPSTLRASVPERTVTAPSAASSPVTPAVTAANPSAPPSTASAPVTSPAAKPANGESRALSFEVTVNGAKAGTWIFVERNGALYVARDAFDEWRVQLPPEAQSIRFRGEEYWPLSVVREYKSKIDFANQSIDLAFSAASFAATRLTQEVIKRPVVSPVLPSAFFNYDLNYSLAESRGIAPVSSLGMLAEIGASTDWGVLTSSSAGSNLGGNTTLGQPRKWVRLETLFTKDFPDHNRTFRLGDTRSQGGMLGRDVYFGGVQFGTNFGLSPGFVTQPLPTLNGASAAQSTVELYVNDVLRQVSNVPTGPFTLDRLPGLTGSGEARMVVRDLLGRETVIVQPFFTSSRLLAEGLTDWRVEAGSVRRNLGTSNALYGPGFVNGAWRHGISNDFTLEATGASTPKMQNIGLGVATSLPWQLLGKAGVSLSEERSLGAGNQWLIGVERQTYRNTLAVQMQTASIHYRQLGQDVSVNPTKQQFAGNWTYATADWGSFGVGLASIRQFDDSQVKTVSANYSIRVGDRANLSFTANQVLTGSSSASVAATLMVPLGNNIISTAAVSRSSGRESFHVTASQNPGQDQNLGWRVLAGREQELDKQEGGLYYQGQYGRVSGDISQTPVQTATRIGAAGGMVLADGHLFATRRVDQSFAIVEAAGLANVGVGLGNNMLTRTDANGVALIPQLAPYQNNQVRLNAQDLPVSAEIESIEKITVPPYRSATKVTFPVRSGRGALLKIVFDDGEPAPAGAIVRIEGDAQEFYVARRGEAFVTGLQPGSRVTLIWKDRLCAFDVALPKDTPDEIPRVGPLSCKGVSR